MSHHKFAVGQNVQFSPDWPVNNSSAGQYTIVRLCPNAGSTPQYRIKSKRDGHERMVPETTLDRLAGFGNGQKSFPPSPSSKQLR